MTNKLSQSKLPQSLTFPSITCRGLLLPPLYPKIHKSIPVPPKIESWEGLWLAEFSPKLGQSIWTDTVKNFSDIFDRNSVRSAQNVTRSQAMFDNVKGEYFLPEVHVVGWLKLSGGSPSADYKQGKYRQIYQIICFLLLFPVYRLPKVLWGFSRLELPFGSPQGSSGGQGKNLSFSFCHMPHS